MKCKLSSCSKEIPKSRKGSAQYCSYECYYEQKKARSSSRYRALKATSPLTLIYEGILAFLYDIQTLEKPIYTGDLEKLKFNFGYSEAEVLGGNKMLCKKIGKYCYYINKNTTVQIWKLK